MKEKQFHIKELISACKKQDNRAQMEIYNRFSDAMYASAIRIVKNPDDAEDAMQEGFIKAFEKIDQFKGDENFGGWLKKIVIRKTLNYYYYNKRIAHSDDMEKHFSPSTDESMTLDGVSEQSIQLQSALKELKDKHRIILQLFYLEGYDYEEIGDILNLSYANCRTIMSRAKSELKKIMV